MSIDPMIAGELGALNPEFTAAVASGVDALQAGQRRRARQGLSRVVREDPSNATAWLWLSEVVERPGERELCLEQVIRIEPDHVAARYGLSFLRKVRQVQEEPPGETTRPANTPVAPDRPGSMAAVAPQRIAAQPERSAPDATQAVVEIGAPPVADMDDLIRPAITAARSGHAQRARELLDRVITIDEKNVSSWMWLSYVAHDAEERDRCLRKVLSLALPGSAPSLVPAGAVAGAAVVAPSVTVPSAAAPAVAARSAAAPMPRPVARPTVSRQPLSAAVLFDGAGITGRLRTLYLEWATAWTFIALAYLAAIAVAEILTAFAPTRAGLVAHAAVLLGMLIHAARVEGKKEQAFLVSLAFAPLIRVISLSLPLADLPLLYWYPITSIPLFAAVLIAAPTLGYRWPDLGLNLRRWGLQLVIGLSGIALGVLEYWILRPEPLVSTFEWRALLWPALILLVSTGLLEEMIFRGLLQRASMDVLGVWGIGYVAILFAVLHTGYQSLLDVIFVLVVGLAFGWIVHRTRSLLGVTLAHGLTNIVLFLIMPFVLG